MKVRIIGSYFGTQGYSAHVRGLVKALLSVGIEVGVSSNKPEQWERFVSDEEKICLNKPSSSDEIVICVSPPPNWRTVLSERPKHFIGFVVWEGHTVPKSWLNYMNDPRVTQLWVPSNHVLEAIEHASQTYKHPIKPQIHVVPHGYDPQNFHPKIQKKTDRPFTFLAVKGWVHPTEDRGGMQYAIRAFYEEFKVGENVRLMAKINGAYINIPDKNAWIRGMLESVGVKEKRADILVTADEIPEKSLYEWYGEGDVFVCATRSEGFNLPGLEAHACGLPTIQTGFGGQTDYMSKFTDYYIPYELGFVDHDLAYEEIMWATPSIAELRKIMRHCFENQDEVRNKGFLAYKNSRDWTWNDTGVKAFSALNAIKIYSPEGKVFKKQNTRNNHSKKNGSAHRRK